MKVVWVSLICMILRNAASSVSSASEAAAQERADLLRYSMIVVASLPMMLAYPFVQKYFVKGVMLGSVKG